MIKPDGQILVIFGASGDLTKRKLLPSLYELFARDMLPENFVILGVARTPFSDEEFRIQQKDNLKAFLKGKHPEAKQLDAFLERVHYLGFNSDEAAEYHLLVEKIAELRKAKDIPDHLIFYLATPPQKYGPIAEALRKSKLNKASEEGGWRRIIVEKPFGSSLETAQALNKQLCSIFDEEDIYRIDHFLGKETVQNILVLRFANQIFESLWNRNYIDSIEIYAAEKLGVENRGKYYEGAGALRDMIQNHLMQLMGFVAMEAPSAFDANLMRDEVAKVFRALHPLSPNDVIRGQYIAGKAGEESVAGYAGLQAVLDEGYITNVAVRPDCRRQGIAGKLLQVFLDFAKGNHLAFLSLEVRASNYDAIALYGSRGFRSVGRRKNYYEHPREDAIIMTKEFEHHGAENPVS